MATFSRRVNRGVCTEAQKARQRAYNNRPDVRARTLAYYAREDIKERAKEYKRQLRSSPEGWARKALYSAKKRAERLGLDFDLTLEDLVLPDVCPALGIALIPGMQGKGFNNCPNSPSVDRIDNTKGYVRGNVRVISLRANILKKDATLEEIAGLFSYMYRELGEA